MGSELGRALDQISEIHGHLSRTELYRGLGPAPVALSSALAVAAAWLQPRLIGVEPGSRFAGYWVAVAAVSAVVAAAVIAHRYLFREDDFARRRTRTVLAQFLPAIAAGAGVTLAVLRIEPAHIALLPGLWAVIFGLGIFAARPHLPRAIGWVALYYLLAGIALIGAPAPALGTGMALVFGLGQAGAALVLHSNVERARDGR